MGCCQNNRNPSPPNVMKVDNMYYGYGYNLIAKILTPNSSFSCLHPLLQQV